MVHVFFVLFCFVFFGGDGQFCILISRGPNIDVCGPDKLPNRAIRFIILLKSGNPKPISDDLGSQLISSPDYLTTNNVGFPAQFITFLFNLG